MKLRAITRLGKLLRASREKNAGKGLVDKGIDARGRKGADTKKNRRRPLAWENTKPQNKRSQLFSTKKRMQATHTNQSLGREQSAGNVK